MAACRAELELMGLSEYSNTYDVKEEDVVEEVDGDEKTNSVRGMVEDVEVNESKNEDLNPRGEVVGGMLNRYEVLIRDEVEDEIICELVFCGLNRFQVSENILYIYPHD